MPNASLISQISAFGDLPEPSGSRQERLSAANCRRELDSKESTHETMKRAFLLILCVVTSGLSTAAQDPVPTPPKAPAKHEIVTAAQANGVYRYHERDFRILLLGDNKMK